jgi:hypothetical protein
MAKGFWESQEHRWREVESYYHTFLGRDLDLNNPQNLQERAYWTNQFLSYGAQEADVVRGFLTSAEYLFKHRGDASLTDVINADLLAGTASPDHLTQWRQRIGDLEAQRAAARNQSLLAPEAYKAALPALAAFDDEAGKRGVLFDALASDEYAQQAVASFYKAMLRRTGTGAEIQVWVALHDSSSGQLTLGTIAELVLASPEYRKNAAASEV